MKHQENFAASQVAIQNFEHNLYCNMVIDGTGFTLSCRLQADRTAVCSTWHQRYEENPQRPSDAMRKYAEGIAAAEFSRFLKMVA